MIAHGVVTPPFWLAVLGIFAAWLLYVRMPQLADQIKWRFRWAWKILDMKYGFDEFNQAIFANGTRSLGGLCWRLVDVRMIDDGIVNGVARTVRRLSDRIRNVQSGFVYHYAFTMIIGLFLLITWFISK